MSSPAKNPVASIFRKSEAVLVNGPHVSEQRGLDFVEPESCQDVHLGGNPLRKFLETSLATITGKPKEDQELQEIKDSTVRLAPIDRKPETVENYDICREYSYDSEDDVHNRYFNMDPNRNEFDVQSFATKEAYVLGRKYHVIQDYNARRSDEASLFWFTYRSNFPTIEPYGITTDAGWGCMLRALQMLMGQALRLHFRSRDWRPPTFYQRRQDPFLRSILTWFADYPSSTDSFYSLHNMVAAGMAYDKLAGEWYGPGIAAYVLRDLVELHDKMRQASVPPKARLFRVHVVASGGTVYRDAIEATICRESKKRREQLESTRLAHAPPPSHPLDVEWEESIAAEQPLEWDTSLLLLIPLRLGLKHFNESYVESLAFCFSLPQSVGVLGGRPRGARWFYGAVSDGSKIFGLDPHTVQPAPKRRTARVNGIETDAVEVSDDYLRSVHTTYPEVCSLVRLDPSIAIGFYCKDRADLARLISSLQEWRQEHPDAPELFSFCDTSPDYSTGRMADAVDDDDDDELLHTLYDRQQPVDDGEEDEYVVL